MALRCVIVDDSPAFLDAARGLLQRQGLRVVAVASNGSQALRLAGELRPDVVLLDVGLNGESGFDVARLLQRESTTARLPVILISTLPEEDYGELISASPAVGFLPKIALSVDAISGLLRRRDEARPFHDYRGGGLVQANLMGERPVRVRRGFRGAAAVGAPARLPAGSST